VGKTGLLGGVSGMAVISRMVSGIRATRQVVEEAFLLLILLWTTGTVIR